MSLRNGVKRLLRIFGHAAVITVHDRLNEVDRQLAQVASQLGGLNEAIENLAEADGALLQGAIRTVEELKELQSNFQRQSAEAKQALQDADAQQRELLAVLKSVEEHNRGLIDAREGGFAHSQQSVLAAVSSLQDRIASVLENDVLRQVCVETGDYEFTNPETGLLSFLYSYLPGRVALDIGANQGSVSEPLLNAGYEVYAFEPAPEVYGKLVCRLGNRKGFHAFPLAMGSREAEMPLHLATDHSPEKAYDDPSVYSSLTPHSMPPDLPFTSVASVTVKTLAGLHAAGTLPEDIGLVKIDTEGFDLEVIRGMGERRYPVVAAEFWDAEIPFGGPNQLYTLESLVGEMRSRGYFWHIVLFRIWGKNQSGFYCNHRRSLPMSWGNAVFFRDRDIFTQAQAWCSATLPRTYFKAAQA